MSTKGSWQRPVNKPVFDENYDRIFGKQKKTCSDDPDVGPSEPGDKLETHPGHDYQPTYDH